MQGLPSHVVASLLEFNHALAPVAPLPAFLLCLLQEIVRLLILGTLARGMPFAIAGTADLGVAPTAAGCLPPALARVLVVHVLGLDPLAAPA